MPDPLEPCGYGQPAGQPVYAYFNDAPAVDSTSLTASSGALPHCLIDQGSVAFLFPRDPLPAGETITATIWAGDSTTSWTFSTAAVPLDANDRGTSFAAWSQPPALTLCRDLRQEQRVSCGACAGIS